MAEQSTQEPRHVLFVCTANSARSIMAEAILNKIGAGRFVAHSAGSHPSGTVNPAAIELLEKMDHNVAALTSKSWEMFSGEGTVQMDYVFTVCDQAAGETCPIWPGAPMSAHWGIPDPAAVTSSEAEKRVAFADAYRMLTRRIEAFTALPIESLDRLSLKTQLAEIGRLREEGK